jgi:hypothetical protein
MIEGSGDQTRAFTYLGAKDYRNCDQQSNFCFAGKPRSQKCDGD